LKLSYIIVTQNRREPLLRTLRILHETTPLPRDQWETWVVDNGSTDGTRDAVRKEFPKVQIIARPTNEGVWSRSYAFDPARGEHVILLDDDSYPIGDTVSLSIAHLDTHPSCAAVVGRIVLPDASLEACALPLVMLSGAVCIRRSVLLELGGFRPEFFRKAGEYDLSFRIWDAGYSIERFEDIIYRHDKVATGRNAGFAHRMDLRNNLILVERYLPKKLRREYRRDWIQRYTALARHAGHAPAAYLARCEGMIWRVRESLRGRTTLSSEIIETLFAHDDQTWKIARWARQHAVKNAVIADFSKNLFATYDGCRRAGLRVIAIADNHPAFAGLDYRGVPVLSDDAAIARAPDGIVISNINPAQIDCIEQRLKARFTGPILRLWRPMEMTRLRQAA
jgi:GT2 family glycosyltransferase